MTALARYDTIFAADSPMDGAYSTRAEPNCDNASFADSTSCGMLSANPERTSASNATPVLQSNPVFSIRAEPRDVTISTPAEAIFGRLLFMPVKNDWIMSEATSIKSGAADAAFSTIWAKISPTVETTSSSPPLLNASWSCCTMFWASFTTSFSGASMFSYREIPSPSNPDFRIVI